MKNRISVEVNGDVVVLRRRRSLTDDERRNKVTGELAPATETTEYIEVDFNGDWAAIKRHWEQS